MELSSDAMERARRLRMVLLDVDGVLTDGRLILLADGTELKVFHTQDGVGIRLAQQAGIEIGVITGRSSPVVDHRCAELGMTEVHQGQWKKLAVFEEILDRRGIPAEDVGFVGDDLVDLPVLQRTGLAVAVANACPEVLAVAHATSDSRGGQGAVREVLEAIIKAKGKWEALVASYVPHGV
jgi:3-deoxy-D-manno-octulosonate 8-phosphate phosphatase (KDO 8-P phosphatase)